MIFTLFRMEIGAFYKEKAILAALYMSIVLSIPNIVSHRLHV